MIAGHDVPLDNRQVDLFKSMARGNEDTPMTIRMLRVVLAVTRPLWPRWRGLTAVRGQMPVRPPVYAITNAKIVTVSGAVIDKGHRRHARRPHRRRRVRSRRRPRP